MGSVLFTVTDFTACRVSVPVVRTVSQFHSPFRPASHRSDWLPTNQAEHSPIRSTTHHESGHSPVKAAISRLARKSALCAAPDVTRCRETR